MPRTEFKVKKKTEYQDLSISVENPKGSVRHWYDPAADEHGETKMLYDYGFFDNTEGMDGDEVDVFVGPNKDSDKVFVVTQMTRPEFKEVDEQKVMVGFDTAAEAKSAYLKHFNSPKFFGSMKEFSVEEFKDKLKSAKGRIIKSHPSADVSGALGRIGFTSEYYCTEQYFVSKSALKHKYNSGKIEGAYMLYLDPLAALAAFADTHNSESEAPSVAPAPSQKDLVKALASAGSKLDALSAALKEEDMDLQKECPPGEETKKSEAIQAIEKALTAGAIAGLSRRERANMAYRIGMVYGQQNQQIKPEAVQITHEQLGLGVDYDVVSEAGVRLPVRHAAAPIDLPIAAEDPTVSPSPFWKK